MVGRWTARNKETFWELRWESMTSLAGSCFESRTKSKRQTLIAQPAVFRAVRQIFDFLTAKIFGSLLLNQSYVPDAVTFEVGFQSPSYASILFVIL